jgi:hypothetical protein
VQEKKTVLEHLKIRVEKRHKDTPINTMEGMLAGETMQIIAQGSANFMITPDML